MTETDPDRLADELEEQADELERHRDELAQDTDTAREDWERKRSDASVPGANPPEDGDESSGDEHDDRQD